VSISSSKHASKNCGENRMFSSMIPTSKALMIKCLDAPPASASKWPHSETTVLTLT